MTRIDTDFGNMILTWLKLHFLALSIGILLDLLIGDPEWMPHPIRWMGKLIADYEKRWNLEELTPEEKRERGRRMTLSVVMLTGFYTAAVVVVGYLLHPAVGVGIEAILSAYMLAAHSMARESSNVRRALELGTLQDGRDAVARIVGRETAKLSEVGVIRAAVETVAENTSDGVIAPLFYLVLGGPILGCIYKAINTMDSMVGYKDKRYLDFGRAAAKLDDAVNFLPARLTGGLLTLSAFFTPGLSGKQALRILRRDAAKSTSPNSGHPEAAVAGALGVELLGDAFYHGELVHKPVIGDPGREIRREDISRANQMMFSAEGILVLLTVVIPAVLLAVPA